MHARLDLHGSLSKVLFVSALCHGSLAIGCSACDSNKGHSLGAASARSVSSAAPSASASVEKAPERRSLTERTPLDAAAILSKHAGITGKLNEASDLLGKHEEKSATSSLVAVQGDDPVGAATALTLSRVALAAGDTALAASAARLAVVSGAGRNEVVSSAHNVLGETLEKLGRPKDALRAYEAAAGEHSAAAKKALERLRKTDAEGPLGAASTGSERRFDTEKEACAAIVEDVKAGKVDLAVAVSPSDQVECTVDLTLDVKAPGLSRAVALRVDVKTSVASTRGVWVALSDPKSLLLYGPVASVFGPSSGSAVNDVVVDLQQIDVLPGGSPEIVAKIEERRTLPDAALAEVLETDRTSAVLLTLDRGGLQASREVVLSSRVRRDRIGPKPATLPHGFSAVAGLGTTSEYSMKVAWSGANSMSLTKASGNAKPDAEGTLTLFP